MQSKEQTETRSIPSMIDNIDKRSISVFCASLYIISISKIVLLFQELLKYFETLDKNDKDILEKNGITRDIKSDGNNKRYGKKTMESKQELRGYKRQNDVGSAQINNREEIDMKYALR